MNFWQRWLLKLANAQPKAISHRPDLAGRQHIYSANAHAEPYLADFLGYATVYTSYVWVHKAIGKIADNFAALPVRVVDADDQPLDSHPITELLAYVNDEETPVDLWSAYVTYKLLGGEAPIELVPSGNGRQPVEMWMRRPDWLLVRPDMTRLNYPRAAEYVYAPPDEEPVVIEPEWFIHDKFFNPLQPYRGLAPISAVREGIIIDLFSQAWSKRFMRNNARPDFALVAPQGITASERDRYMSEFLRNHQGVENAHMPVVLEDGVTDIKTFSFPPKDMEWLEQRRFSRDEVGALFGVPDEIMGFGRDTYENFQTALEVFWLLTLQPLALRRDVTLTSHFRKGGWLRPNERIASDFSGVGVLQDDTAPKIEMAIKLWDRGVPWNVLDERFGLGIGAIPGGDVGYVSGMMIPVERAMRQTEPTLPPRREPDPDAEREAEERRFRTWAKKRKNPDPDKFNSDILSDADKAAILVELQEGGAAEDAPFPVAWSHYP